MFPPRYRSYPLAYRDGFPGDSLLSSHGGSILFLLFGLIYFYEAMSMKPDVDMSIPISVDGQS